MRSFPTLEYQKGSVPVWVVKIAKLFGVLLHSKNGYVMQNASLELFVEVMQKFVILTEKFVILI